MSLYNIKKFPYPVITIRQREKENYFVSLPPFRTPPIHRPLRVEPIILPHRFTILSLLTP